MKVPTGFLAVLTVLAIAAVTRADGFETSPYQPDTVNWTVHANIGGGHGPTVTVKLCHRAEVATIGLESSLDRISECTTITHQLTADEILLINSGR